MFDSVRGPHSTGVVFVHAFTGYSIVKKAVHAYELLQHNEFNVKLTRVNKCLMGHNRWATTGAINNMNAHPFETEKLVGMHNGTLINQRLLDDHTLFAVDSENIFHHLDLNGVEDTMESLYGAFALVWFNKVDNTLNFIRNSERPLHFILTEDKKTLFWASERWMMEVAMSRHGIKAMPAQVLEVGDHVCFDIPAHVTGQSPDLPMPTIVNYKDDFFVPAIIKPYVCPFYGNTKQLPSPNQGGNQQPAKKSSGDTQFLANFTDLNGCFINFEVLTEEMSKGNHYILGRYDGVEGKADVRIYCPEGGELWKSMAGSKGMFSGRVKGASITQSYLLLDVRSVEEWEYAEDDEEENDTTVGYDGTIMTRTEFEYLAHQGCAWCDSPAFFVEADEIEWLGPEEFVCGSCKHEPDVRALAGYALFK